ncbi:hypothetical protein [Mycobacteroides abscessus]|uniref:hypothetical protein n=1 Tax=Mycobacteroides abscessus TaxID=36809 RepID=UPI0009275B57|nr:hypothetical protein [Mycobacteroides abscessus]SIG33774.1 Uncharacterised protein [Mycobacteroides abscessus subsp. abscessus]SIG44940.1 Uncharacterised protein [Mycobacteroides abscessus subsp. abscessus]SIM97241.1 Uncharacterised protein [Mycobacteroides abscessus subsp. abscessus]SIN09933.1 Uncharacterised protein [Mycobacteroides abscessus subsp. abscessus]SIN15802.1 Uncharacterised protein [Mycobacteroides abscessus subsp. abscessus]
MAQTDDHRARRAQITKELERMATLKRPLTKKEVWRLGEIITLTKALAEQHDNQEFRRLHKAAKLVRNAKGPRRPSSEPPRPAGLDAVLPSGLVHSRRLRQADREVQGGLPASGRGH